MRNKLKPVIWILVWKDPALLSPCSLVPREVDTFLLNCSPSLSSIQKMIKCKGQCLICKKWIWEKSLDSATLQFEHCVKKSKRCRFKPSLGKEGPKPVCFLGEYPSYSSTGAKTWECPFCKFNQDLVFFLEICSNLTRNYGLDAGLIVFNSVAIAMQKVKLDQWWPIYCTQASSGMGIECIWHASPKCRVKRWQDLGRHSERGGNWSGSPGTVSGSKANACSRLWLHGSCLDTCHWIQCSSGDRIWWHWIKAGTRWLIIRVTLSQTLNLMWHTCRKVWG